mmetsp:Transcript_32511/g.74819  ORF Transcript_32511/g.74819 Transcript_32511/m.74819 type:complete len:81 (-) Transcript_32511:3-245(-)
MYNFLINIFKKLKIKYLSFDILSIIKRKDVYVLLTRTPQKMHFFVRLACVKHITSVYSEPGSNSFYNNFNILNMLKLKVD